MNTQANDRKKWQPIEYCGLVVFLFILACIFFFDDQFSGVFNQMFTRAYKIFEFYLFGASKLGATIVVSVITGRVLERLGLTDALMRIFTPCMKIINVNAAVVVGVIYNILGDVNAAGRIAGPVVMKAGCTKDEQKIAIATLCNAPCSFSIMVLGLMALSACGLGSMAVVVMLVGIFLPIFLCPALFKLIWRDTKACDIVDLPRFTPNTGVMDTLFGSAREGAQTVFLIILPAGCVVFAIIGILEYFGLWATITTAIGGILETCGIERETGLDTIVTAGTLAMAKINQLLAGEEAALAAYGETSAASAAHLAALDPSVVKKLVIGSYVLANSSWPIQVPLGQIPGVWSGVVDLSYGEIAGSAFIGCVVRLIYAMLVAQLFGLFV